MGRWRLVSEVLFGISAHVSSNVGPSLEEPYRHPNHLKYLELQDILMPSLNRAVGLAIALSKVEQLISRRDSKDEFQHCSSPPVAHDTSEERYRQILQDCMDRLKGAEPEHYADIAATLLAVLRFIRVTAPIYITPDFRDSLPEEFLKDRAANMVEIEQRAMPLVSLESEIKDEFLRYLMFATRRVINRLENADIGDLSRELL